MKNFTFNKVYIIRSLSPTQPQMWQPGEMLRDELTKANVNNELVDILDGWIGFNREILRIAGECVNVGVRPIVHFICHGGEPSKIYPKGAMKFWNENVKKYDIKEWEQILPYLEYLNLASHFNLFVSMCVCHGFYSLLSFIQDYHRIPFCGLLASPDPISVASSKISFTNFYISLVQNQNVNNAIDDLHNSLAPIKPVYERFGIKMEDYLVVFSDELFTKAAKEDYKKNRSSLAAIWRLGKKIYYRMRKGRDEHIRAFVGKNLREYPTFFLQMRDYKFMLDVYPEERPRFELPNSIGDLK